MPNLPPYVEAKEHLPVRARVRGFHADAVASNWRGERVYLRWKRERGNHLGRVSASDVERRSGTTRTSESSP